MTFELGLHIGMLGPPIGRSQGPISILVLGFFVGQIWAWPKNGPFLCSKMEMDLPWYPKHLDH